MRRFLGILWVGVLAGCGSTSGTGLEPAARAAGSGLRQLVIFVDRLE